MFSLFSKKSNPQTQRHQSESGFTLIELLVVIFILGVLASLIATNLQSARQRARDAKKKSAARDMQSAFRLYYNDYQHYPLEGNGLNIVGCGEDGQEACPASCDADFAAGPAGNTCETVYLQTLPETFSYRYYSDDAEKYCFKVTLENLSDSDLQSSFEKCGTICEDLAGTALDPTSGQYAVCNQ